MPECQCSLDDINNKQNHCICSLLSKFLTAQSASRQLCIWLVPMADNSVDGTSSDQNRDIQIEKTQPDPTETFEKLFAGKL